MAGRLCQERSDYDDSEAVLLCILHVKIFLDLLQTTARSVSQRSSGIVSEQHSVGIYSETTHNLATVVSARPAPAACFYNPRMPIRACAV